MMSGGPSIFSNYAPAEADWGIEEYLPTRRFNSTTASDISHQRYRPFILNDRVLYPEENSVLAGDGIPQIASSTENFHKYISKYLCLKSPNALILDKFKYSLVVSNLLDESLVLSKNEQALANLLQLKELTDEQKREKQLRIPGDSSLLLKITLKLYQLIASPVLGRSSFLFNVLLLIIFLLKQNINLRSQFPYGSRVRLFRILLLASTRLVSYKRAWNTIEAAKCIRCLEDFMITNCKINKTIITTMLSIKELEMFHFLNRSEQSNIPSSEYSADLRTHLDSILTTLVVNVRFSIRELLPFSNGEMLEKYCEINNISLGAISQLVEPAEILNLESLTAKLLRFNSLRRFLVCQLLAIHDTHLHNFFILKLCDSFNVSIDRFPKFVSNSLKLQTLCNVFNDHNSLLEQVLAHNSQFRSLRSFNQIVDFVNDDVLASDKEQPSSRLPEEFSFNDSDLALDHLIDKLQSVTTSLKYFKKYKKSIQENKNAEEHEEKMSIFNLFGKELISLTHLHLSHMSDLKAEYNATFIGSSAPSSFSNSNRNSSGNDQFNLKAFHTSARSSGRHVSLPAVSSELDLVIDKRLKRLLAGLQLGLLTVLEEPSTKATKERTIVLDPLSRMELPNSPGNFNTKAFEALTRKQEIKNSYRYSMYSLNSNISGISDLIASSHITTDAESPDLSKGNCNPCDQMSKAQLKQKLEDSYSRLFNFEDVGKDDVLLKPNLNIDTLLKDVATNENFTSTATHDETFLGNLEETLNLKVNRSEF